MALNRFFKQYIGTIDQFKEWLPGHEEEIGTALVFIHETPKYTEDASTALDGGWIFANGFFYSAKATNLTAQAIADLVSTESNVTVEVVDEQLVITAADSTLSEDLVILDPLIEGAGSLWEDSTIPEGTPIEDILKKLLQREIHGTKKNLTYSLTASVTAPSPSFKVGTTAVTGNVEVGTEVSLGALAANASSLNSHAISMAANLTDYGYQIDDTKYAKSDAYSQSVTVTGDEKYTLDVSYTGFGASSRTNIDTDSAVALADAKCDGATLTVANGTNTVYVKELGETYTADKDSITESTIYFLSNTSTKYEEDKTAVAKSSYPASKQPSDVKTASLTGYYKVYAGCVSADIANALIDDKPSALTDDQRAAIRALASNTSAYTAGDNTTIGTFIVKGNSSHTANMGYVVALPSGVYLKDVKEMGLTKAVSAKFTATNLGVDTSKEYRIYVLGVPTGDLNYTNISTTTTAASEIAQK